MNQVILIGIVEQAAEVHYFGHHHIHAVFTLCTSEHIPTPQDPNRIIETRHRVSAWGDMALRLEREVRAKAKVRVAGRLSYERDQSPSGDQRIWATIVCSELETLQLASDLTSSQPLAPAAPEVDWSAFSPEANEDPMA